MRIIIFYFLAVSAVQFSSAEKDTVSIRFQPDWFPNGQFAGFYSAIQQEMYAEDGLDVEIDSFAFGSKFMENVASNRAQFGTIEAYILMNAISAGQPLIALGAVLKSSPGGYVFLEKSNIRSGVDLQGKRVGIHAYAEELLPYFIKKAQIDSKSVTSIVVKNDIEKLLSGEIDLLQGYAIDEYLQVKRASDQAVGFITFEELGLPMYSMILYTNRAFSNKSPEVVEKFMKASAKGWEFALNNPKSAATTLSQLHGNSTSTVSELEEQIIAIKPFVAPPSQEVLRTDRRRWETMNERFLEAGLIDVKIDLDAILWPHPNE